MSVWQPIFIIIATAGGLYLALARRLFDVPALAYFSACFYFLPGFVGYAGHAQGLEVFAVPLEPATYAVFCSVLSAIFLTALLRDRALHAGSTANLLRVSRPELAAAVGIVFGVAGMLMTVAGAENALFHAEKSAVMGALSRWHLLWACSASIAFVFATVARSIWLQGAALALLLLNLYVGFRVDLVVSMIAAVSIWLLQQGPTRLASHWLLAAGLALITLAMFVVKYLLVAVQLGDIEMLQSQIRNPEALRYIFLHSEPFIAQGTLNEVIRQGFWVGPGHLLDVLYLLVPFAADFGVDAKGFNALFQPALFSTVTDYGLGNNIWAEMLASGGWLLLGVFLIVYCLLLSAGDALVRRLPGALGVPTMLLLTYWSFYIHRNDLLYQLTLMRRVALVAILVLGAAMMLRLAAAGIRSAPGMAGPKSGPSTSSTGGCAP